MNKINRYLAHILLLILYPSCDLKKANQNNDLHLEKLKGAVKSVSTRNTEGYFYSNKTYNQNGYEIESEVNESDFPVHILYKRDDKNNIIEKKEEGSSEGSKYKILTVYKYDNLNNMVESKIYDLDGALVETYSFIYNKHGDQIEENRTYSTQGKLYSKKYNLTYNDNNKLIEKSEINALPYNISKEIYEYDNNGNIINSKTLKPDGTIQSIKMFGFDDKKNKIEEGSSYEKSITQFSKIYYKYDNNSNVIEESHYEKDGTLSYTIKYDYEFDNSNNWIKRTDTYVDRSSNSKISGILERTIEYYKN